MRNLAENIWVFDGDAVSFLCLPFTTRMTVVKLSNGELWIHSPIKLTGAIQAQIQQLGKVKYLIAPNHLHHLFLAEWQLMYPDAICYGTNEVIKKRNDIAFNSSLNKEQRDEYKKRKLRNRRHQGHLASSLLLELLIFALLGGHLSHNHFLHLQRR